MKKQNPENLVKKQISDWLDIHGWFHFPILQSLGSYRGIPDKIAIKAGFVLFIELKSKTGRQSEYQKEFQKRLEANGGHYIIARGYEDVEEYIKRL